MRPLLVALMAPAMALAGCSDGGGPERGPEDLPDAYDDIVTSQDKGAIVGIVVNEAIVPLAGVKVSLQGVGDEALTDDQGAFLFNDLEPGTYFLLASKLGYQPAQASAEAHAGDAEPPLVRIQLIADPQNLPYATTEVWEGFVSCAATVGADGVASAGGHICDESVGSRYIHEFAFADGRFPDYVQDELVWDNTQPLGDQLSPGYYRGGVTDWKSATGTSPVLLSATGDELRAEEAERGENLTSVVVRVFPGTDTGAVATYNQAFVIYHTTFYGFEPRDGWRFTEDGACEPAEKCAP